MTRILTAVEARILGCLIEKEFSTPEYYPLTLNSLVTACNQKSNRHPAMQLGEDDVEAALENLRFETTLVYQVTTSGSRVPKFKHDAGSMTDLPPQELAVLCELLIRGPQTAGELRTRASRMCPFESRDEVEEALAALMEKDHPLVARLPREPGRRESRFAHLLCGDVQTEPAAETAPSEPEPRPAGRVDKLEEDVAALREELQALRQRLDDFTAQFT